MQRILGADDRHGGGGGAVDAAPAEPVTPPDPSGAPLVLAHAAPGVYEMATDATHLYWVVCGQFEEIASVWRVPKTGGSPELLASLPGRAYSMVLDEEDLYFTQTSNPIQTSGSIRRVPKAGGEVVTIADGVFNPTSIALDDDHVYYSVAVSPNGEVWRVSKDGGAPALVAADVDGPWDVAVDSEWLYVSEMNRGRVIRLDKAGGGLEVLASGWVGTTWLGAAAGDVYFGGCASGGCSPADLYRVSREGGVPEVLLTASLAHEGKVAVGGGFVVWGGWYVPLDGSPAVHLLAAEAPAFLAIAVAADSSAVYLADFFTGTILQYPLVTGD